MGEDKATVLPADGKIRGRQGFTDAGQGIDHGVFRSATGILRGVMIGVDFDDAPASEAGEGWRQVEDYRRFLADGAARWFARSSSNRLRLDVTALPDWHRMSRSHQAYGFERGISHDTHLEYIAEGTRLAQDEMSLADYDLVYLVPPRNASGIKFSPAFIDRRPTVEIKGVALTHAVTFGQDMWHWGYKVLNHETGHVLGLPDLYSYQPQGDPPNAHPYVGGWDLMGLISGHAPELLAWQKWRLGWIDDDQVAVVLPGSRPTVHTLDPVEVPGGTKLVVLPVSDHEAYLAECRRPLLHDAQATDQGVLVYRVDTTERGGRGTVKVIRPQGGSFGPGDLDRACFRADQPGRSRFVDPEWGITITVQAHAADFDVIEAALS
jgi:M6 family metalloprotease-like protein